MALPSSGTITAAMINLELGRAETAPFNLNDTAVRALAGKPSGTISFSDFHGKSNLRWEYQRLPTSGGPNFYIGEGAIRIDFRNGYFNCGTDTRWQWPVKEVHTVGIEVGTITDTPFSASDVEFRLTKRSGVDFAYSIIDGMSAGGVIGGQEMKVGVWYSVNAASVGVSYIFEAYNGESLREYTFEIRHKPSGLIATYYLNIVGE